MVCAADTYIAPEVLLKAYDERADIWSLGVCLYILFTGADISAVPTLSSPHAALSHLGLSHSAQSHYPSPA